MVTRTRLMGIESRISNPISHAETSSTLVGVCRNKHTYEETFMNLRCYSLYVPVVLSTMVMWRQFIPFSKNVLLIIIDALPVQLIYIHGSLELYAATIVGSELPCPVLPGTTIPWGGYLESAVP